jgi:hypothetical protein
MVYFPGTPKSFVDNADDRGGGRKHPHAQATAVYCTLPSIAAADVP